MTAIDEATSRVQEVVARQFEALNRHDSMAWAAAYHAEAVVLDPQHPEPLKGRDAIARDISEFFTAFPNLAVKLDRLIEGPDAYAIEFTMRGTHKGPLLGPFGHIPATDRRMEVRGAAFARLDADGRIADERRHYDLAGLLDQLGLLR